MIRKKKALASVTKLSSTRAIRSLRAHESSLDCEAFTPHSIVSRDGALIFRVVVACFC